MDAEQLREDVRQGRVDVDRLVDLVVTLAGELQQTRQELQHAQRRIEQLERQQGGPTAKLDQPFSMQAEERRQEGRGLSEDVEVARVPFG